MTIGNQIMRFLPATLALSLVAALTASVGHTAPSAVIDPRAADLVAQGRAALAAGQRPKVRPTAMEVHHGDEVFGRFRIERVDVEAPAADEQDSDADTPADGGTT